MHTIVALPIAAAVPIPSSPAAADHTSNTKASPKRTAGDGRLWSLYDKFERAYNRMNELDTPEAREGSGPHVTPEQLAAHKKWERAGNAAFKAARRVMFEPAFTGDGLLMKIHVAGFDLDAAKDTFTMPYRGFSSPCWEAGRFSSDGADFVVAIGEDLRRARLALS
ncbi:hypothetical protein [Bradyrhizobium lablabi]|uniref:hypothetical protein n=1 Tax=Bradyrhizobium lablabi TaxID=722472 RepID=UPI00090BBCFF|nr:hypothetical protein [Bradyrhizobium lablabi]SHM40662.1 hypothetical protein SAMN05444321_6238 [Bradyrhizobium lablabi]